MGMNHEELRQVALSLRAWVGVPLHNVWQPSRDRVVLGFADGRFLLLVPRGPFARITDLVRRPRNPHKPFSFQGACRAHLSGPLTDVAMVDGDRIVELSFHDLRLVLRLTGRSGGLWLVRDDSVVAAYDGPAPAVLPPVPTLHVARGRPVNFEPADDESWEQAAGRWYGRQESQARLSDRRATLTRALRQGRDRARRLMGHLEDDLDKASRAPQLRRQADALAANLHQIERGSSRVALPNWEHPGKEVVVELDPSKPAVATMETLYTRARRLDRVADRVHVRLDEVRAQVEELDAAVDEISSADSARLAQLGTLVRHTPQRRPGGSTGPEVPWATWVGPRGERVLVGKNARGNRRLTFQVAKGDDFWFHLRERPGAHVLMPMRGGKTPDSELLLAAAQLVLIAAKVQQGRSADIQYTRARHVRAIPGEIASVRVANEKVLHVARDPAALVGWTRE